MAHRSTEINYALRYCPHAVTLWESGAPYDTEGFAAGIAAHAVLQEVGEAQAKNPSADVRSVADNTVKRLCTEGRAWDARPEPPMSPVPATAGRDIALAYLATHTLPERAQFEMGLAVDKDWRPVPYDAPTAWWRAILDVAYPEVDDGEDYSMSGWVARDYKSAWSTSTSETLTLQLRGQALLLAAHHPTADYIRREATNLRTGVTFAATTMMDDAGKAEMDQWRKDIAVAVAYANTRVAKPGPSCAGCPFVLRCEHARAYWADVAVGSFGLDQVATAFAVVDAARDALATLAKAACAEGNVTVPGGVVGFMPKVKREPSAQSAEALAAAWFKIDRSPTVDDWPEWRAQNERVLGLIAAAKIGSTGVDAIGKILYPYVKGDGGVYKERRQLLADEALTTKTLTEFGHRKTTTVKADDEIGDVIDTPTEST